MFIHGRAIGGFLIALTLVVSAGCNKTPPQDGEATTVGAGGNAAGANGGLANLKTQVADQKQELATLRGQLGQAKRENNVLKNKLRTAGLKGTGGERVHELRKQLEKYRAENRKLKGQEMSLNMARRENVALRGKERALQAKIRKILETLRRATAGGARLK